SVAEPGQPAPLLAAGPVQPKARAPAQVVPVELVRQARPELAVRAVAETGHPEAQTAQVARAQVEEAVVVLPLPPV
ncbi:MAG: hypothetical protein K9K38_07060, partial [Rhodoferax sp.]|nr:hypothetical protein [Rhodoferax sp.]